MTNFYNLKTLSHFSSLIDINFNKFKTNCSKISESAEAVNQSYQALFNYFDLDKNSDWQMAVALMVVPAHQSWINSYLFSIAGYLDSAFSEIRRAIEFTCYALKVQGNNKRANDWIKQKTDLKSRKQFINWGVIPLNYTTRKYFILKALLVAYDVSNYFGAHATFETLSYKIPEISDEKLKIYYQSSKEIFPLFQGYIMILGYQILQVFKVVLNERIKEKKTFDEIMKYNDSQVKQSQVIMAKLKFNNNIPDDIINSIYKNNFSLINKQFDEYIKRETKRKVN